MTRDQFDRLKIGDEVFAHFANSYRRCRVVAREAKHLVLEAPAINGRGRKLTRRALFGSVDLRAGRDCNGNLNARRHFATSVDQTEGGSGS